MFRCEAVSTFIRHLAVNCVSRGYFFYVQGEIPPHKDAAKIDAKIAERYGIEISKWTRARRRKQGKASIQYLRCRHRFVLLATPGEHSFFHDEAMVVRDIRREPIKLGGYSIGHVNGHVSVRIQKQRFAELKEYMLHQARKGTVEGIIRELLSFSFAPFAPVCKQIFELVCAINSVRKVAGLESVPFAAVMPRRHARKFETTNIPPATDALSFGLQFWRE